MDHARGAFFPHPRDIHFSQVEKIYRVELCFIANNYESRLYSLGEVDSRSCYNRVFLDFIPLGSAILTPGGVNVNKHLRMLSIGAFYEIKKYKVDL